MVLGAGKRRNFLSRYTADYVKEYTTGKRETERWRKRVRAVEGRGGNGKC